ncbi:PAS domain-containing protein [Rhodocytophaga rosea]|uniref:histidine kinase n=1 Tax=Rhodocytophaga rosea TaxID=2704465 RepID=A0A6C0GIX8_9BACT|nr:PAS domain-containing sensor histidine kinase [Rhodocytophaga rosea]QHT67622.1 PAS domain-containing protein [Rhodocytophaga rosea]
MIKLTENAENFFILEQVAEKSAQAFFIFDVTQQHLHYVNPAFEQIWQRSRQSIYPNLHVIMDTIHPEDRVYLSEQYQRLLHHEENKSVECRIVLPDGSLKWVCFTAYLIHQHRTVRYIAGYAEDISKSKEYSYNLLKFNAKKNAVLEIISHDLAAPFNTIQGIAGLIENKLAQQDYTGVQNLLKHIKDSSKRGSDLIRDFVTQEFLESSEVVLNKSRIDIVEKIRLIIEDYKNGQKLIPKQFELTTSHDSIFIELDEMKFVQVLNNLISNAIKFTRDNGTISLHVEEKQDTILITVADNGIGIPKTSQPVLFEKFTKARRPGLRGEKSVGLGMSVIKTIVELHQGTIWFESEEDEGSQFFIEIPKIDQTQ